MSPESPKDPNKTHAHTTAAYQPAEVSPAPSLGPGGEEQPGAMIGPYKLLQKLGKGGMGVVWEAEQREPIQRRVAVKIIKANLQGEQVVARFEAERQALALMDHANIARVLDAGATATGQPYFVMELVNGVPFTEYCDQQRLTLKERLELFIPVCSAVQHAHQKGIIHRDLKPSNVLVALYDGKPAPKVIDFGVAKAIHQKLTERTLFTVTGQIVGTFEYMAPEQAELDNLDIDTRADIYSLGVMLYQVLTGALPLASKDLRGAALLEMVRLIKEVEPMKPSTKLSGSQNLPDVAARRRLEPAKLAGIVRGDLDWIVMKCLEKERGRRYETATQLAEELNRHLHDEPVQAGPPSVSYRARKFLRRNQGPVVAASLVVLALVVGMIGATVFYFQAESARAEEALARGKAEAAFKSEQTALEAEKAANLIAQRRLKQIEHANKMLESIFNDVNLHDEEKGGPTLLEQLTRRLGAVAESLKDDAIGDVKTVARLRAFLGNTLNYLGEPAKAIPLLEKARDAFEQTQGPKDSDTLVCKVNLAFALNASGQWNRAIPEYEKTLKIMRTEFEPDDPQLLSCVNNLGTAYLAAGEVRKAIGLLEDAHSAMQENPGPDDPRTLACANNLATAYQANWQPEKAVPLLAQTFAMRKKLLGPKHIDTLTSMNNLARVQIAVGHLKDGLTMLESLQQLQAEKKLPADHPNVLSSTSNLAGAYLAIGKHAEATKLYTEVLAKRKQKLPPDHPDTLSSMHNLASAYQEAGQMNQAIPLYEATRAKREKRLAADHPDTLITMNNLALCYRLVKRFPEALELYERTRKKMEAKLGPDHAKTLLCKSNLAEAYHAAGQLPIALPLFKDTLGRMRKALPPNHPNTLSALNNYASALQANGEFLAAIELFEEAFKGWKETLGPEHADTVLALENLAFTYLAAKKVQEGMAKFDEFFGVKRKQLGPDSLKLSDVLNAYGFHLLKLGQPVAAEPLLRECLTIRMKLAPDAWFAFNTKGFLGVSLLEQKKLKEAEPLLTEGYEGMKEREADIPPALKIRLTYLLERLVMLHEATGNDKEAVRWRKELAKRAAREKK